MDLINLKVSLFIFSSDIYKKLREICIKRVFTFIWKSAALAAEFIGRFYRVLDCSVKIFKGGGY